MLSAQGAVLLCCGMRGSSVPRCLPGTASLSGLLWSRCTCRHVPIHLLTGGRCAAADTRALLPAQSGVPATSRRLVGSLSQPLLPSAGSMLAADPPPSRPHPRCSCLHASGTGDTSSRLASMLCVVQRSSVVGHSRWLASDTLRPHCPARHAQGSAAVGACAGMLWRDEECLTGLGSPVLHCTASCH